MHRTSFLWLGTAIALASCGLNSEKLPKMEGVPTSINLSVPFSPQAPFANWDPLHEEACEEMSLIMVHHFLEGTPLSREAAEQELQELIAWEGTHGYPEDVTVAELGAIANAYYGYSYSIYENPSVADLQNMLVSGSPIIVPAAGRMLGNPYFSGEGPWYHMLVVRGFDRTHFITNDAGTKRGEGYRYRPSILQNAIHDWTGIKEGIAQGKRIALTIEKTK